MHNMDVQISPATHDDMRSIQFLFDEYYRDMHEKFPAVYRPVVGNVKSDEEIAAILEDNLAEIALARASTDIVGFVCVRETGIFDVNFLHPRKYGLIRYILVCRNMRRRGIGRKLVQYAIDWSADRGLDNMELTVWHDNAEARNLYRSFGFRPMTMQLALDAADSHPTES